MQARLARVDMLPVFGLAFAFVLGILMTTTNAGFTLGAIIALAFTMLSVRSLFAGLLVWIVMAPLSSYIYLDLSLGASVPDITLTRLCAGLLFMIPLAQMAAGRRRLLPLSLLDIVMVFALLGLGLSITMTENKMSNIQSFADAFVIPTLLYWIARNLVQSRSDLIKVVVAFMIVGAYSSAVAIYEQFTGEVILDSGISGGMYSSTVRRLTSLFGNPTVFAVVLGMSFPFAFHFLLSARSSRAKIPLLILIIGIMAGLLATALRTAWIASLLGLMIMVVFHPAMRQRGVRAITLALIALATIVAIPYGRAAVDTVFSNPIIGDRLFSEGPAQARILLYDAAARMARDYPLRGTGYSNFTNEYLRYLRPVGDIQVTLDPYATTPHNSILWVLASAGLIGAVPYTLQFVLLAVYIARAQRREPSRISQGLFIAFWVGMLSYFLNAMTTDVIFSSANSLYFFLLAGAFLAPNAWKSESQGSPSETTSSVNGGRDSNESTCGH